MVITQAKRASRRATFTLRSAISPVCSANLSSAKRSRPNALTTRIEEIVSCVREVKSPSRCRTCCSSFLMRRRKYAEAITTSGAHAVAISPILQSMTNMTVSMPTNCSRLLIPSTSSLSVTSSSTFVTSLVTRVIMSPVRCLSWKVSERRCMWAKRARRTLNATRWLVAERKNSLR
jgi:hypothetical protein